MLAVQAAGGTGRLPAIRQLRHRPIQRLRRALRRPAVSFWCVLAWWSWVLGIMLHAHAHSNCMLWHHDLYPAAAQPCWSPCLSLGAAGLAAYSAAALTAFLGLREAVPRSTARLALLAISTVLASCSSYLL